MSRTLLLAATALAIASSAVHADHDRFKWDGAMQIDQTEQCGGFHSDNLRSRYHPGLQPGDPNSSFTLFQDNNSFVQLIINSSGNVQFNGTGQYSQIEIGEGQVFDPPSGTYDLTQTPANILATTDFVSLVGSLDNYHGIVGCTLTLRAAYVRVDPEIQD
jgi:hypothetical protein